MENLLQKVLGGAKSEAPVPSSVADADFADFQSLSAEPSPAPLYASTTSASVSQPSTVPSFHPFAGRPYTKWYRVWERVELRDFQQEAIILPFVLALLLAHFWGTRSNKRKAHKWMKTIAPVLQAEFAQVGFTPPEGEAGNSELIKPEDALKHVAPNEYTSFATGRQNIAFADFRLTLLKWYNPFLTLAEYALNFAFDSLPAPAEKTEITLYPFDGSEKELVPSSIGPKSSVSASSYDGFVWAVVHKNKIKSLRDERYDLSLTSTKDHPKLPGYLTVMTESAEISDAILSPELVKAIEEAGNDLETIIVTDQPIDAPKSLDGLQARKRLYLSLATSAGPSTELLSNFIRLADRLPKAGHFRPEVQRRLKATREAEISKVKKLDDEEKAEARKTSADKKKKEERDKLLKGMNADQQRKFLEKEREKERRKGEKRRTMKA